jgi:hypothetical protein
VGGGAGLRATDGRERTFSAFRTRARRGEGGVRAWVGSVRRFGAGVRFATGCGRRALEAAGRAGLTTGDDPGRVRGAGRVGGSADWCGSVIPTDRYGSSTTAGNGTPAMARPAGTRSVAAVAGRAVHQPRRPRREGRAMGSAPAFARSTMALTCRLATTSSIGRT